MERRYFEDFKGLLNSITAEQTKINKMQAELKDEVGQKIKRFFLTSNFQKKQFRLIRKEKKQQIKVKQTSVYSKIIYLDSLCNFNFDSITQFLVDALTIIEGEEYQKLDLEFIEELTLINTPMFDMGIPYHEINISKDYFCVIGTKKNIKLITDLYYNEELKTSNTLRDILDDLDGKYILLKATDIYQIFDYSRYQVSKELTEAFSYLSEIIFDLMTLKLKNQNLSDNELTLLMLKQMPQKYLNLIEVVKQKK